MRRRFRAVPLAVTLAFACAAFVVYVVTHMVLAQAAEGGEDASVPAIGVGGASSSMQLSSDPADKLATTEGTDASVLEQGSARPLYEVRTIGPEDAGSVQAGVTMEGDTVVVTRDEGWQQGIASAYSLATNDGYDATASGVRLTETSMTVAVPASRADLLGKTCEIYYNGVTVTATVTDTGGFAPLGRDLDLAGGVWRALGATSIENWGVRTVSYRFVD